MALTTILQGMLADNAVTTASISAFNVQSLNISSSAIENRHLVLSAVNGYNIGSNSIEPRHIRNSTIETRHVATSAISLNKLNESVDLYFTNVQVITTNGTSLFIQPGFETVYNGKILHIRDTSGPCTITFVTTQQIQPGFNMTILNESLNNVVLASTLPADLVCFGTILSGSQNGAKLYSSCTAYKAGDQIYAVGALSK
jgi:hypothetical protein